MKSSIEYIANFKTSLDPYNGITILSEDLPKDILEFEQNLKDLIQNVKDNKNLIWIYIDIKKSDFIPIATKFGFTFHSCNSDYILLVKVLKENGQDSTAIKVDTLETNSKINEGQFEITLSWRNDDGTNYEDDLDLNDSLSTGKVKHW